MRWERNHAAGRHASARRTRLALLAAFVALVVSGPAHAGLLTTGTAATCDQTASQPFSRWDDSARYILVGGGSFEGTNSWTLRGGAAIVAGNEPFYVRRSTDSRSLYLPAGASATSPTTCFKFADWHLRLFTRNTAGQYGGVKVEVLVPSLLGILSILDGGTISASGEWKPSPRIGLLVSNLTSILGTKAVAVRLTAVGAGFQVDDVYLDPWKSY
jgi:hypothetical protein